MSAHIIGRPNDDLLDIMLGHGADPEQAFIRGSEQGREEGDGFEDHPDRRDAADERRSVWPGHDTSAAMQQRHPNHGAPVLMNPERRGRT